MGTDGIGHQVLMASSPRGRGAAPGCAPARRSSSACSCQRATLTWQVHRAVLRTGEEVVVKVQRENLLDLFAVDLWNIKLAAWLADRFDPQTEATAANWKVRGLRLMACLACKCSSQRSRLPVCPLEGDCGHLGRCVVS